MTAAHTQISDELLAAAYGRVGRRKIGRHNAWNTEATYDAIKHFAWGIGDDNPLWTDREYAAATTRGGITAPPTWLYSCMTGPLGPNSGPSRGEGLPGLHGLHAGDTWEFYEPVRVGDPIRVEREIGPVEKIDSAYAGETIQTSEIFHFFREGTDQLLATRTGEVRRHERGTPQKVGRWNDISAWTYTDEAREAIADQYESERPRGQRVLDWSTLSIGDEIPARLKGPLTSTSMVTYLMGWGSPFCMTDRIAHEYMRLHPGANVLDVPRNVRDFPERAHWDEWLWNEIGFPLGYDIGTQRISWFAHLLTDWAGDDGWVEQLNVQLREPNWLYDITWCRGTIERKYVVEGRPTVELSLRGESQRGRTHTRGRARVVLGNVSNVT